MVETNRATRRLPVWADVLGYWVPGSPWRRAWAATRTIADHGELVARWLAGEYRYTPGHVGPADDETAAIRADLVRLCRAGVVTTGSQPGATGTDQDGRWVQRAYLTAYGNDDVILRLALAAAAAGLWVESTPHAPGAETMPSGVVPVTFDPDTDQVFTGSCGGQDVHVWDRWAVAWHPESLRAWQTAAQLHVVDPTPGRERLLWDTLTAALTAGAVDGEAGR